VKNMAADEGSQAQESARFLFLSAIVSGGIAGFLGNLLTKLFLGEDRTAALEWSWIVALLFFGIGLGIGIYYWTVFGYGAFAKGSPQRDRYNRLRTSLRTGGRVGPTYERMLRATLEGVDRFFGDNDQADRTLFPHAFGLKERAPLWTARSFDRCLVIALIYPIAVILLIWAATGRVGPAEGALQLPLAAPGWKRGLALGGLAISCVAFFQVRRPEGWRSKAVWMAMGLLAFLISAPFIGILFTAAIAISLAMIYFHNNIGLGSVIALLYYNVNLCSHLLFGKHTTSLLNVLIMIALMATLWLLYSLYRMRRSGQVWSSPQLVIFPFILVILSPTWSASDPTWPNYGPILLFFVLITLINAPFDWMTVGLTRALLRRGLELGGWWPLAFGLIDLFVATAVVVALAVATLWSVQMFGHLTTVGGGAPILGVEQVVGALADPRRRTAPEYWWLYAMLFSTLVPSIMNVALGALSILRGIPGLHAQLARRMPVGKGVLESERIWMVPVLTLQVMLSGVIGTAVMLGLIWAILGRELPFLSLNLVSMLQALVDADLPLALLRSLGIA
jgi:hypothetical protein